VDACERLGIEPVPLLYAGAQPSGTIDRVAYDTFKQEILDGLANNGVIDGVMLCLHGAGVVEGIQDLEGDLARAVRVQVGEAVPVVASFDLHGNITQDMADALDGVFACHHYPHIDLHKRSAEAVALIQRMLEENFRPVTHVASAPMLISFATTFLGPGKAKLAQILLAEEESGVIDVSWFHGFPYTDTVHVGTFVAVTTEGDREQARRIAEALAEGLWADRETFRPRSLSADEAVVAARLEAAKTEQPVVIHETSDNCGGGAPGDGTHLLRAMLDAKLDNACFGFLVDPEVASVCHEAGVGARLQISLGGKYDDLHGAPLELTAYVKSLHDGRIRMRAMFKGAPLNLGPMARLVVDGMDVIVASRRSQTFDIEPFLAVGIDVMNYDFVALKSSAHFRAGFQDLAGAIVTADPPGLTTLKIEVFPRERAPGPLWPVDG
ncbi:MAG: M81 family peptidase, partial [Gammaproteobacteria bacterium]